MPYLMMLTYPPLCKGNQVLQYQKSQRLGKDLPPLDSGLRIFGHSKDLAVLGSLLRHTNELDRTLHELAAVVATEEKQLHVAYYRSSNALLPAVKLPFEILVWIFELACDAPFELNKERYHNNIAEFAKTTATKYAIGSVCSHWREVLLTIPSVWSDIFVQFKRATLPDP